VHSPFRIQNDESPGSTEAGSFFYTKITEIFIMNRQVSQFIALASSAGLAVFVPAFMAAAVEAQSSATDSLSGFPLAIPAVGDVPVDPPAAGLLPPVDASTLSDEESEAMLRGPVHEAFAEQVNPDPVPGLVIQTRPPEAIEELPPDVRPEGRAVEWISGYWAWDEDRDDFMWVSGIWREVPQGFRWLPGYWSDVEGGYQWVSGTWVSTQTAEIEYLQTAPPVSLEQGPVGFAPTVQHIWIPGCWTWTETRYLWRPGYWSAGYDNWVWVPARYNWTPAGYYYCNGYWDYPLERRGVLFAPWYFDRRVYSSRRVRFTPQIVVASNLLQFHFWVRPRYQHYYFGDYYGAPYASRGLMPWHQYHRHHHGSDPLFCHYSRGGNNVAFYNQVNLQFNVFVSNPNRRPARTFRAQDQWVRQGNNGHDHASDYQNSRLGNRFQNVVDSAPGNSDGLRFVKLENEQRQHLKRDAEQTQSLALQRRSVEKESGHRPSDSPLEAGKGNRPTPDQANPVDGLISPSRSVTRKEKSGEEKPAVTDTSKIETDAKPKSDPVVAGDVGAKGERPARLKLPAVERSSVRTETVQSDAETRGDSGRIRGPESRNVGKGTAPTPKETGLGNASRAEAEKNPSRPGKRLDVPGSAEGKSQTEITQKQRENKPADVPQTPVARGERPRKTDPSTDRSQGVPSTSITATPAPVPAKSDRQPGVGGNGKAPAEKQGRPGNGGGAQSGSLNSAVSNGRGVPQGNGRPPAPSGEILKGGSEPSGAGLGSATGPAGATTIQGRRDSGRKFVAPPVNVSPAQEGRENRQKQPQGIQAQRLPDASVRDAAKSVPRVNNGPGPRPQMPSLERSVPNAAVTPNVQPSRNPSVQQVPRNSQRVDVPRQQEGRAPARVQASAPPLSTRGSNPVYSGNPQSRSAPTAPVQRSGGIGNGGGAGFGRPPAGPRATEAAPQASGNGRGRADGPGLKRGKP